MIRHNPKAAPGATAMDIIFAFALLPSIIRAQNDSSSLRSIYDGLSPELDPPDYIIHDPSKIITLGGKQLIAVTGKAPGDGYDCGLETWWRPVDGGQAWQPGQCLFRSKPSWVAEESPENDGAYWAPELDLKDGVLTLIYSVAEWESATPNTCVGVARAVGNIEDDFPIQLKFEDQGHALTCINGANYSEERSAIDPSVFWGFGSQQGRLYLVTGGGYIIGTELDPITYDQIDGVWFDADGSDWSQLARGPIEENQQHEWVEAPYVHPNPETGYYYLFVNWYACCRGVDSTYEIAVGRSRDPMGPYVDENGKDLLDGGGTVFLDAGEGDEAYIIGPGHTGFWRDDEGNDIFTFHYYDGNREGNSWIGEKRVVWNQEGWPVVDDGVSLNDGFPYIGNNIDSSSVPGYPCGLTILILSFIVAWI